MNFPSPASATPATPINEVPLTAVLENMGWKRQILGRWLAENSAAIGLDRVAYVRASGNVMLVAQETTEEANNKVTVQTGVNAVVNYNEPRVTLSVWVPLKADLSLVGVNESADLIEGYTRIGYSIIDRVGNLLYLNTMIVEDRWQGSGFGGVMMSLVESIAKSAGATKVVLHPTPHPLRKGPKSLAAWYKSRGYKSFIPRHRVAKLIKTVVAGATFNGTDGTKPRKVHATKWAHGLLSKKVGAGAQDKMASVALVVVAGALDPGGPWGDANDDTGISVRLEDTGFKPSGIEEAATQIKDAACYAR